MDSSLTYFSILVFFPMHNQSFVFFTTLTAVEMIWWFWVEEAVNTTVVREKELSEAMMKATNLFF